MAKGQIEINVITNGAEKVSSLEKSMSNVGKEAEKAKKDTEQAINNAGKASEKAVKSNKQQIKSIDQLTKETKELTAERNKSTDTKKIKAYNKELAKTDKEIKKLSGSADKFGKTLTKAFAFVGGAVALKKSIDIIKDFDQGIADLGAILGKTEKELDFFKTKSLELGLATSNSASDVVEAFKLVGSAKPELLANSEALAEVTRQSLILANATGLDVKDAVDGLTGALNQFDLGAESASKAIDILSAGSKAGAVAVPALSAGLKNFGAVANANNVTLQQSIALQETLGEKQIEGGEAGSNLRNIILKLSNAGKGYVDGQFDINQALIQTRDELNAIEDPITRSQELTKLFGLESVTAGQILLDNIDTFEAYTLAVDENGVAQTQATQRLETVNGAYKFLTVSLENYVLGVGESTNASGALVGILKFLGENINLIINSTLALVGVFGTYKAVLLAIKIQEDLQLIRKKALVVAQKAQTIATTIATTAMKLFNLVMKANPVVLFATAVIAATTAVIAFSSSQSDASRETEKLNNELVDLNKTLEKSKKFIKDINNLNIDVDASVNLDLDTFVELEKKIDKEIKELEKKEIKLKAFTEGSQEIIDLQKLIIDNQKESEELTKNVDFSDFSTITVRDKEALSESGILLRKAENSRAKINVLSQEAVGLSEEAIKEGLILLNIQKEEISVVREQRSEEFKNELARREAEKEAIRRAKRRKENAKKDAKARLKLETDLQKQLTKLTSDAEAERREITLNALTGEERIQKELQFRNEELDTLQEFLISQNTLITRDLNERKENEIQIITDVGVFRENSAKESAKKVTEFRKNELEKSANAELALIQERLSGIDIGLEFNNEGIDPESEITLLQKKIELLDQELFTRREILETQLLSSETSEEEKNIIQEQITNLELKNQQQLSNINNAIIELEKAKTLTEKFDNFLGDLFGTNDLAGIQQIKQTFAQLAEFGAQQFEDSINRQIATNQDLIDQFDENISSLESQLAEEQGLRDEGEANNVEGIQRQIDAEKVLKDQALVEQEKLAKKQEALNKIKILSELTVAVASLIASQASKGLIGLAIAGVAIPALFSLFSKAKTQATTQLAEGDVIDIKKGNDYKKVKGKSHKDGGERLLDHVEVEGEESIGVLRKEVSEKDREQWRKITKHLNGKKNFKSFFNDQKIDLGQSKSILASLTNVQSTDMKETNQLIKSLTSALMSQGQTQDLGSKTMTTQGITRQIRKKR